MTSAYAAHHRRKLVLIVTLSCMLLFAVKGDTEVVYENDFSTRTSANAIPTSDWCEIPYSVGILARDYARSWSSDDAPYEISDETQDGWALANYGKPSSTTIVMAPALIGEAM